MRLQVTRPLQLFRCTPKQHLRGLHQQLLSSPHYPPLHSVRHSLIHSMLFAAPPQHMSVRHSFLQQTAITVLPASIWTPAISLSFLIWRHRRQQVAPPKVSATFAPLLHKLRNPTLCLRFLNRSFCFARLPPVGKARPPAGWYKYHIDK